MTWPQLIFGWPAIIFALAAFGWALLKGPSLLGFVGLMFAAPFLWYASHAPSGLWFSGGAFLMLAAAAESIRRGRRGLAAGLVAPFAVWVLILGVAVATQN
jgi:hypothetical protein